ncbi:MAG: sugar-transfer associated ATP-grasp domain-containing protein [Gemmatimonadaceae bacterium]
MRLRRRLWHRLLTPGWGSPTAAARLRGWYRVLAWDRARTPADRGRLLLRAFWMPVRAWREAGREVEQFGAEVQVTAGLSPDVQRRQLWWLSVRHGLDATSYIDYQLYRPERRRRAAAYLQESEHTRVVRWYNRLHDDSDARILRDKPMFYEWCRAHDLPAVPTLVEFEHGEVLAPGGRTDAASSLPASDLFSKPVDATGGHGTARWRLMPSADGGSAWIGADGHSRTAEQLLAELAGTSVTLPLKDRRTSRRMLLQPCLRNHADLLPLTPGALCTLRILAFRAPGGPARIQLASYRLAIGDAPADNFHFGGMMAPVDIRTGRLGTAVRRQGRVLVPVERHPDTGATIAGHQLPFWPETLTLASRALDLARRVPLIGWDIAITDDGPVLIEANAASNPDIAQAPTGTPLSDTPLPAALEAHVREYFGI